MNDQSSENDVSVQILADDLPDTGSHAAPGEKAPITLESGDGSWLGSRTNKNYEAFLNQNRQELEKFEEQLRAVRALHNTNRWLKGAIADSQARLDDWA
jgi:hypothetical protein